MPSPQRKQQIFSLLRYESIKMKVTNWKGTRRLTDKEDSRETLIDYTLLPDS